MSGSETLTYGGGEWGGDPADEPSLTIEVHESDLATVTYRPAPEGLGRFYLGYQPRDYYDDPAESEPVDLAGEAEAFAAWAAEVGHDDVQPGEVRALLAEEGVEDPQDVFVEETVERLLRLVGLPVPDALHDADLG
ncbi:hypothetical protein [Cellulomonas marina]|uniref:Uncharacterized protein n=1 Tax=Cellulomonas marina TaxID=988821 RepID=A0A1I0Z066_9CELL|nr:hypothetical protein [Cellulomonas marina]GIG28136.1 hypothetical protein Cma02nite_07360 [Cellulomonas marina]SFB18812.1 hypothetical protein SAMN05421867_10976 [Cellulomonas marina]